MATNGGSKLSRTQTVTVRLDPKLRYLAELAARKQRRTVSSFAEWAIEDALKRVYLEAWESSGKTINDMAESLWDVDDADRFAKLALTCPEMLTHPEQFLWKLIRECGHLWRGATDTNGYWQWRVEEASLNFERLRTNWELLLKVAAGQADRSILPTWKGRFD